jgi:endonuclease-3 related protein
MLYGHGSPVFVADAYARIMARHGIIDADTGYEKSRCTAEPMLPCDAGLLAEAHALIVEHAKQHCRFKPYCTGCAIRQGCRYLLVRG